MIVVMQCAGRKQPGAGTLHASDGKPVKFVAYPESAPNDGRVCYARPDDSSDFGGTWREHLVAYNRNPGGNPLGLLPAVHLYADEAYRNLVKRFGPEKVYILSAGWGLIRSDFLTPDYDITFQGQAEEFKRRRRKDPLNDLQMISIGTKEEIVFIGSQSYLSHFCRLTQTIQAPKLVYYNLSTPPRAHGCRVEHFPWSDKYRWFYACANALAADITHADSESRPESRTTQTPSIATPRAAPPRSSGTAPNSATFREELRKLLRTAAQHGAPWREVNSGVLHRSLGGYPGPRAAMPSCCNVMRREMQSGDVIVSEPPKGRGARCLFVTAYLAPS